jgi:PucR-like helix-turn-helix protein/diguanylate cyclase with GGDEF domain
MSGAKNGYVKSLDVRGDLAGRLRSRRAEIEEVIFARVRDSVSDPAGSRDAEYTAGLRAAVAAAVEYGLMGIEQGEEWSGPIPPAAVVQAHRAARTGVELDTVLRRYAAGYTLLEDFIVQEADGFPSQALRQVLATQGSLLESLMASIATEYRREVERAGRTLEQRRSEHVQRLLAGEPVDTAELGYEFDAWHVGVIATGAGARGALRGLGEGSDRQLLLVSRGDQTVWAWLGGRRRLAVADVERLLPAAAGAGVSLVVGEPGSGLDGWRLTHRQAQAALVVALHTPQPVTRYAENMLLAAALRDEMLARSLKEVYLAPLAGQRDGGAVSRETLRAYFAAGRNAATAAQRLGVDRHTVGRRLQAFETLLGRPLYTCQAELEVALRLEELGAEHK